MLPFIQNNESHPRKTVSFFYALLGVVLTRVLALETTSHEAGL